jgi:LysM domain
MFDSGLDTERAFGEHGRVSRTDVRRRGRRRLALALTVSLAGAAWAGPAVRALGDADQRQVTRSTYVVRTGDTLWSIAERLSPGEDPRPLVDALTDVNGLEGALVPGQAIVVPAGV